MYYKFNLRSIYFCKYFYWHFFLRLFDYTMLSINSDEKGTLFMVRITQKKIVKIFKVSPENPFSWKLLTINSVSVRGIIIQLEWLKFCPRVYNDSASLNVLQKCVFYDWY